MRRKKLWLAMLPALAVAAGAVAIPAAHADDAQFGQITVEKVCAGGGQVQIKWIIEVESGRSVQAGIVRNRSDRAPDENAAGWTDEPGWVSYRRIVQVERGLRAGDLTIDRYEGWDTSDNGGFFRWSAALGPGSVGSVKSLAPGATYLSCPGGRVEYTTPIPGDVGVVSS